MKVEDMGMTLLSNDWDGALPITASVFGVDVELNSEVKLRRDWKLRGRTIKYGDGGNSYSSGWMCVHKNPDICGQIEVRGSDGKRYLLFWIQHRGKGIGQKSKQLFLECGM